MCIIPFTIYDNTCKTDVNRKDRQFYNSLYIYNTRNAKMGQDFKNIFFADVIPGLVPINPSIYTTRETQKWDRVLKIYFYSVKFFPDNAFFCRLETENGVKYRQ